MSAGPGALTCSRQNQVSEARHADAGARAARRWDIPQRPPRLLSSATAQKHTSPPSRTASKAASSELQAASACRCPHASNSSWGSSLRIFRPKSPKQTARELRVQGVPSQPALPPPQHPPHTAEGPDGGARTTATGTRRPRVPGLILRAGQLVVMGKRRKLNTHLMSQARES